jgi:four helix bundle protein
MNNELGIKSKIYTFKDLDAWKEGHKLVLFVYRITSKFPKDELFALTSQMRRCVVSITSNIAEGFSRQSYKEKVQFYSMALGSVTELQNQLTIAKDLFYIGEDTFSQVEELTIKVHKIINGLIKGARVKFNTHNS